jgi:hypothetical protein
MSIFDLITDWRFALSIYCLTGLALVVFHPGIRKTTLGGSNSFRWFIVSEEIKYAARRDPDASARNVGFRIYALVVILVVAAIVAWPLVVFSRWQEQGAWRATLGEIDARVRDQDFSACASELFPVQGCGSFDVLWRTIIPEESQEDLPRFIHFRYTVKACDESIGRRGMLGTLAQEGDTYWGNFTHYQDSHDGDSPKTTIPVRMHLPGVRKLMAALRTVQLRLDVPACSDSPRRRFNLIRRLAVSAPIGCPPCLFEMASDETFQADAHWDCVNYLGWAIDSVHARRNNNVWYAEDGVDEAFEDLIDAMDIRQHLTSVSAGLQPTVAKTLG